MDYWIQLVLHVEGMNPIDYQGQRSKMKITLDKYANKFMKYLHFDVIRLQ